VIDLASDEDWGCSPPKSLPYCNTQLVLLRY